MAAPNAGMENRELYESVMALPDKYRDVIILYYYQEMTLDEAAGILGIGKSTVHLRLKKARQALRIEMERSEWECVRTW